MNELGVIKLKNNKRLFIEVEEVDAEEHRRLASNAPGAARRPTDLPPGAEPVSAAEEIVDALAQLRDNIGALAEEVQEALQTHRPQQWSLEFSIGFKGKANPIPFIVQGEANAALKVTATWKR